MGARFYQRGPRSLLRNVRGSGHVCGDKAVPLFLGSRFWFHLYSTGAFDYENRIKSHILRGKEGASRGLGAMSGLRAQRVRDVLNAWDRSEYQEVVDACEGLVDVRRELALQNVELRFEGFERFESVLNNFKAAALIRLGRYTEAIKVAEGTLSAEKDRDAYCIKGAALNFLSDGNPKIDIEALRCYTNALALKPENELDLEVGFNQAALLFKLNKVSECVRACDRFLREGTDTPEHKSMHLNYDHEFRVLRMSALFALRRWQEAVLEAEAALLALKALGELSLKATVKILEVKSCSLISLRKFAEAELVLREQLELDPKCLATVDRLVTCLMAQEKEREAVMLIRRMSREKKSSPEVYARMCVVEAQMELKMPTPDISAALKKCDKAIELDPSLMQAYSTKATCLLERGYPLLALATCDQAMDKDIIHQDLVLTKALSLEKLEKVSEALMHIELILLESPENTAALLHKGRMLSRRGDHNLAIEAYDLALKTDPRNPILLASKADVQRQIGNSGQALRTFTDAVRNDPHLSEVVKQLIEEKDV
ncbi:uncharacterized protein LOC126319923 [Schistocerca gregaria]|uniref:uncharacterized protein LOC126319923 n=1 Tax=Schistocerca gregaria TaxID=7010 RepID=UPI00211E4CE2|nr:uncharacterized protein LOC126319923 [Schistocerca gregaria]